MNVTLDELKQRQSLVWGVGDYERIAETTADAHELVVELVAPQPGERWLDLACGTGGVAERAARKGASVTGLDLAPALIEIARRRATEQGIAIDYEVGDCEHLSYPDATFDVVSSTFGVMFTPDHQAVAREIGRVTKAGGRLVLANWRLRGAVFEQFQALAEFQPPPPSGAGNPFDWGREEHVTELLGDAFELEFSEADSRLAADSGEAVWDLFSTSFGPTKTLADSLEVGRRDELRRAWIDVYERYRTDGGIVASRPYLIVRGTRS